MGGSLPNCRDHDAGCAVDPWHQREETVLRIQRASIELWACAGGQQCDRRSEKVECVSCGDFFFFFTKTDSDTSDSILDCCAICPLQSPSGLRTVPLPSLPENYGGLRAQTFIVVHVSFVSLFGNVEGWQLTENSTGIKTFLHINSYIHISTFVRVGKYPINTIFYTMSIHLYLCIYGLCVVLSPIKIIN